MLKSFCKILILFAFLNVTFAIAQDTKDVSSFKLKAFGFQYNTVLSWKFAPQFSDFDRLTDSKDSAMFLDQYDYKYSDINRTESDYWSFYVKLFKPQKGDNSIQHTLLMGLSLERLYSDDIYARKRSDEVMVDSVTLGMNAFILDSCMASNYWFRYSSERIGLNLGYAYQFDVNDFLELSFGLNTDFLFETFSTLNLLRYLDAELKTTRYSLENENNPNTVWYDYLPQHSYDKSYELTKGFYVRPWVPVSLSCKLLGFDDDQQWLVVSLQGGLGCQFSFVNNVKARASEYYTYGVGLQYRF